MLSRVFVNAQLAVLGHRFTFEPETISHAFAADILRAAIRHYPLDQAARAQLERLVSTLDDYAAAEVAERVTVKPGGVS